MFGMKSSRQVSARSAQPAKYRGSFWNYEFRMVAGYRDVISASGRCVFGWVMETFPILTYLQSVTENHDGFGKSKLLKIFSITYIVYNCEQATSR